MKLSKNRNVKIISRPCWCPHQHAHAGHATQSLPQFIARNEAISRNESLLAGISHRAALHSLPTLSPSARVGVLTNTLAQGTQLHLSRRSSARNEAITE